MRRLPGDVRARIFSALDMLIGTDPRTHPRRLRGRFAGERRLRVGDWRIRYEVDEAREVVIVLRVLPRSGAYHD